MRERELERLHIVASDVGLLLLDSQLFGGRRQLVRSVVYQPKSTDRRNSERHTVRPLHDFLVIWWTAVAGVEDEEKKDKDSLV